MDPRHGRSSMRPLILNRIKSDTTAKALLSSRAYGAFLFYPEIAGFQLRSRLTIKRNIYF